MAKRCIHHKYPLCIHHKKESVVCGGEIESNWLVQVINQYRIRCMGYRMLIGCDLINR